MISQLTRLYLGRMTKPSAIACILAVCGLVAACDEKKPAAADPPTGSARADSAAPVASAEVAPPPPDPALVARGDYLVNKVMACPVCHTPLGANGAPDMAKKLAGGLEIPEVFGTWRSPNITQDKKTGIGGWTDEQIATALREGKRPNGDQLFSIMPYPFYNKLSDKDVKAVVAYLRTVAPVENAVAGNRDLKIPKLTMPKPSGAEPDAAPVAQGAYLASLMHCAQCHTPLDEKTMKPIEDKAFAGGFKFEIPFMGKGELYALNITPDKKTGIGSWTDDEIAAAITKQKRKNGAEIQGPMRLLGMGWAHMEATDVKNLVAFLRSLKPIENQVPKSTFKPNPPPGAASASPASSGGAPGGPGAGTKPDPKAK